MNKFHFNYSIYNIADIFNLAQEDETDEIDRLYGECDICLDEIAYMIDLPRKQRCCAECVRKIDKCHTCRREIKKSEVFKTDLKLSLQKSTILWVLIYFDFLNLKTDNVDMQ